MPDPETPPAATSGENKPNEQENSVIKQMRAQLDAEAAARKKAEADQAELAAKLKKIEDAELSESERLKREVAELAPLRDAHGKYVGKLESLYQEELSAVPDEKRAAVEALSKTGDWGDRLDAIKAAKGLLTIGAPTPQPMGGANNPGSRAGAGSNPPETKAWDFNTAPRLGDLVFKK